MNHYSKERKEEILKYLLPPHNLTVAEISKQENISDKTLYNWRNRAKKAGQPVPGKTKTTEDWSVETKLAVIAETATFSESELSRYCREKGLFVEQIAKWKQDFIQGYWGQKETPQQLRQQAKVDKVEIKELKKELRYKDKALAETAALLVLRKKLNALWGEENEDN
jgi:transposase-like protein